MTVTVENLSPSQLRAYASTEPRVLIAGGPGTGKTAVALLIARKTLQLEPEESSRRALFLTFSRSATAELLKRAPQVTDGPLGGRLDIATFHSFSMQMLNAFQRYAGGSLEQVVIRSREEDALGVAPEGSMGFDDLVPAAVTLMQTAPWLLDLYRRRYAIIVCDEFQDTSAPASTLLGLLSPGRRLVCLADGDQVIFDWTDSSIGRRIGEYVGGGAKEYGLGYDSRRDPSNVIPRAAAAIRDGEVTGEAVDEACGADRLRLVRCGVADDPFSVLIKEIRAQADSAITSTGVFFATNRTVNEFADTLRREEIEHAIVGLSGATGESQLATATAASYAVGAADWSAFLRQLGVFVAACYRGTPPDLAFGLVRDSHLLPSGLVELLDRESETLQSMAGGTVEEFYDRMETLWDRLFFGRPRMLWELGVRNLRGQSLSMRRRSLDQTAALEISRIAHNQRSWQMVDASQQVLAPVLLMNVYQVKGREMDSVYLVHLADDRDEWSYDGMARLRRLHYVSISRARHRATIVLPPEPKSFFARYIDLCA